MRLTCYLVYDCQGNDDANFSELLPLTIVKNIKEFNEFVSRYILVKNYTHYKMWCELRKYDPENDDIAYEYLQTCHIEDFYNYCAVKVKYSKDNLLSILRMFNKCMPVGASYETDLERTYMNSIIEETMNLIKMRGEKGNDNQSQK